MAGGFIIQQISLCKILFQHILATKCSWILKLLIYKAAYCTSMLMMSLAYSRVIMYVLMLPGIQSRSVIRLCDNKIALYFLVTLEYVCQSQPFTLS